MAAQNQLSKPPRGRGRRTRLTPEIQAKIIALVTAGHYKRTAAAHAGINERTLYQWYDKGDREHPSHRKIYGQFRQALDKAEAESEIVLLDKICQEGTARDFLEVLARRFPDRWAKRIDVGVQGDPTKPIEHRHSMGNGSQAAPMPAVQIVIGSTEDCWQDDDDPGTLEAASQLIETKALE
jgi:transposase-like protein